MGQHDKAVHGTANQCVVVNSTGKEHISQQTAGTIVMDTFDTLTYLSRLKRHIIL